MSQVPHAAAEWEQVLLLLRGGRDGWRHAGRQCQRNRSVDAALAATRGREVQDRTPARQGRHGRGLSRARPDARARSRDQGAAARHLDGRADRQTLQQEAKTSAKLDHTNIIPIYRVESEGGLNYFVMKYIAGTSLEDVLDQKQP